MRRIVGAILVGLGALLLGLGLLAKPYLYPRLATVPLDQESTSISEGKNMSVLYPHVQNGAAAIDALKGVDVKSTRTVVGIPGKVAEKDLQASTAFWQTQVVSQAMVGGKWVDLSYSDEGVSFDRVSAEVSNCCGDYKSVGDLDNPKKTEQVTRTGHYFKFPFDTQQQDYDWWDGDLGKAVPIKFKEVADLYGTDTYVFEQVIPKTQTASREVPASLFSPTGTGNVTAKVMYGNTRTLWVEPNTGVIIKGQEKVDKTLESSLGSVAMTVGTIGYNEKTIEENAQTWGSKGSLLGLIHGPLGWILGGLGVVLLGLGGFMLLAGRRTPADKEYASYAPTDGDADDTDRFFTEAEQTTRRRSDIDRG